MQNSRPINGKKISGCVNRLRQLGHTLGSIRENRSALGSDESMILTQIKEVASDIKKLIGEDPFFSADLYFIEMPGHYESMVSGVNNAYQVDESLLRDEIVFQLELDSIAGFKHWLSLRPHEFRVEVQCLLNLANIKT